MTESLSGTSTREIAANFVVFPLSQDLLTFKVTELSPRTAE